MTISSEQYDNGELLASAPEGPALPLKIGARIDRPRLADNIVSLYILQGLNYAIPMAVLPYLVRVLGMESYGLLAFAQSFAQYFTILTDYGFNFSATRSIAQQRKDGSTVSRIFSSVLVVKVSLMCLGALLLAGIIFTVPRIHHHAEFFFVAYLAVIGNVLFPVWYFQGMQKMRQITIIIGTCRLLGAGALFVFVHHPKDALLALAIQSFALAASGAIGLPIAFRNSGLRLLWPSWADLRVTLAEGWHLFVSTAAISLYTNTNVFLVGILAGSTQAGYFSAAEKLVRAVHGLLLPASQAFFPHASSLVSQSREAALRFTSRILGWMGAIALFSSLVLFVFARPIILFCLGPGGAGSVAVIRWVALLPFFAAVSNVLGVQTMVLFGLDKQFSRILIFAGVFNVALAIPLIRAFYAQGAGASVLCTECLIPLLMFMVLRRHKIPIFRIEGTSS